MNADQPHRRVYAKGYYDGLQAAGADAGIHKGEHRAMNEIRHKSLLDGLTSVAKKVYFTVPAKEKWPISKIGAEIRRTGSAMDGAMVASCLDTLKGIGLVSEPERGAFIRVEVKEKAAPKQTAPAVPPAKVAEPAAPKPAAPVAQKEPALDKLAALASRMRGAANLMSELISDLETAALEIEDQFASREADLTKIKQFKALLQDIG